MLTVAVVGLGAIGLRVAATLLGPRDTRLAALVDVNPDLVGRSLEELAPGNPPCPLRVTDRIEPVDVAIVCTTSSLHHLAPTLRACVGQRTHVVSSCEELVWPRYAHAELADALDREAAAAGVALIGTGVNPGYVMDLLAVQLCAMHVDVTAVRCVRRVDARLRRLPLQEKVGCSLSVEAFTDLRRRGQIGHKGLAQSVALLASGLGRTVVPGSVGEHLEPLLADAPLQWARGTIQPGLVRGMRSTARWEADGLQIELDLVMAVGEPDPRDQISIVSRTPLQVIIPGGTPGDSATVAALVNTARLIGTLRPGLRTMLDLPAAGTR